MFTWTVDTQCVHMDGRYTVCSHGRSIHIVFTWTVDTQCVHMDGRYTVCSHWTVDTQCVHIGRSIHSVLRGMFTRLALQHKSHVNIKMPQHCLYAVSLRSECVHYSAWSTPISLRRECVHSHITAQSVSTPISMCRECASTTQHGPLGRQLRTTVIH